MLAAKGYCQQTGLEYGEYLKLVDSVEYDIISQEKEATLEEYGQNVEHVFQAIVMPFIPDSDCGQGFTNPILHWKILCCISYFHYDRIPRFLLEHCCHIIRESEVKNPGLRNKADVGILTKKLLKHNMCTVASGGFECISTEAAVCTRLQSVEESNGNNMWLAFFRSKKKRKFGQNARAATASSNSFTSY